MYRLCFILLLSEKIILSTRALTRKTIKVQIVRMCRDRRSTEVLVHLYTKAHLEPTGQVQCMHRMLQLWERLVWL